MLSSLCCATCGIVFGLQDTLCARRKEDGNLFWCPNGHANRFGDSEIVIKMRREIVALEAKLDQAKARVRDVE